jgi:hypothetical protein
MTSCTTPGTRTPANINTFTAGQLNELALLHNLAQSNPIDTVVLLIVFTGDDCTPAVFSRQHVQRGSVGVN